MGVNVNEHSDRHQRQLVMNEPQSSGLLLNATVNNNLPTLVKTAPKQDFDEDWEEWTPEKGSFLNHMVAGSAAGVAEHVSIFPIDTIKVWIFRNNNV